MSASQKSVHPLVARHAELIAAHDQIKGNDQSSIAKRAGKVRQINVVELDMTLEGLTFEHFVSPASVRTRTGTPSVSDADLLAEVSRLADLIGTDGIGETIKSTADQRRTRKVAVAVERGLMTEDGNLTDKGNAVVNPDADAEVNSDADAAS